MFINGYILGEIPYKWKNMTIVSSNYGKIENKMFFNKNTDILIINNMAMF